MRAMFTVAASPRKKPSRTQSINLFFFCFRRFDQFLHAARNRKFGAKLMKIKVAKINANKTYHELNIYTTMFFKILVNIFKYLFLMDNIRI